ncbi:MAG TPA: hypothetical protein VIF37_12885 [Methylobacter sp.]|jgi:hypothetical protein
MIFLLGDGAHCLHNKNPLFIRLSYPISFRTCYYGKQPNAPRNSTRRSKTQGQGDTARYHDEEIDAIFVWNCPLAKTNQKSILKYSIPPRGKVLSRKILRR